MKKFLTAFALFSTTITITTSPSFAQANLPTFEVLTPKPDQTLYGDKVPILFNVENFELVDPQQNTKPTPGQGHILIWLDGAEPTVENATTTFESTFIYSDVAYGDHTLTAELVTSDNKSLTPPLKATVNFKSEMLPSEEAEAISSGFDKTTAIVILAVVALVILAAWWYTKDEDEDTDSEENLSKPKKQPAKKSKTRSKKKTKK